MKTDKIKIVYYCTPFGFGHVARSLSILQHLPDNIESHILSGIDFSLSSQNITYHRLPSIGGMPNLNNPIVFNNYLGAKGDSNDYRKHFQQFVNLVCQVDPDLVVVDVTAEFAVYSKIMGFNTCLVYITGQRDDLRSQLAFNSVDHILVPYPKGLTDVSYLPQNVLAKMFFSGGFSRFDHERKMDRDEARKRHGFCQDDFVVICSVGRGDLADKMLDKFAKAARILGDVKAIVIQSRDTEEIKSLLSSADLAVAGAGDNTVMELCRYHVPTVLIPLRRPYDEQLIKARDLQRAEAALYLKEDTLTAEKIAKIITRLRHRPKIGQSMKTAQLKIVDGEGGQRAARQLIAWAKD